MNTTDRRFKILFTALIFVFSSGLIIGAIFQKSGNISPLISDYSESIIRTRINACAISLFKDSLILNISIMAIICVVGVSQIGRFFDLFIVLCYGIGYGAVLSNLTCDSGVHGLVASLLMFVPGCITSVISILYFSACVINKHGINVKNKKRVI